MDDEDDRRLLDFIGDVQALNEYLHGSNSKSIGEEDVTNATYGSASSFFITDSGSSNAEIKEAHNNLEDFGETDSAGLQLSSSLPFIEDDLDDETSPGGVDLEGEDQPFDILQKSLLEADITEQTLAQEALLDSQPSLVPTAAAFPQQLVSGGFEGVTSPQPQAFLQQVPQLPLPNGPAGHIQVVGSFNGSASSMMTINSLEQPQILLRQSGNVVTNSSGQGAMFAPSAAVSFNKGAIPVQNIIIQRGPTQQTLVRPIQPKPLQTGGQTLYNISNIGLQPSTTASTHLVSSSYATTGSSLSAQQVKVVNPAGGIVMHSPLGQQGQQSQPQSQLLLPSSISLNSGTTVPGFQAVNGQVVPASAQVGDTTTYSILTSQNATVQLISGQNFPSGGQLILNQSVVGGGPIGQASPTPVVQVTQRAGSAPLCQTSVSPEQQLLVPVAHNTAAAGPEFQISATQDAAATTQRVHAQLINLLGTKAVKSPANQELPLTSKRPAPQQLTRGGMVLQQLRRDHHGVLSSDRTCFASFNDVIDRLLPYHVFQGSPQRDEDFTKVDEEFETVATQVLKKTQAMVNKYRRLLMVESERSSPSSEMVMIDRTFNQEERSNLTQDKRTVLVDPDGFLEDFCCGPKRRIQSPEATAAREGSTSTSRSQEPRRTPIKCILSLKNKKISLFSPTQHYSTSSSSSPSQSQHGPAATHEQPLPPEHAHSSLADTDSVLEAAVNSILEC